MMKFKYVLFLFCITQLYTIKCQATSLIQIEDSLYAESLNQQIYFSICLPNNWSNVNHYPALYALNYGSFEDNGILVAAHINNFIEELPEAIVINIKNTKGIGFNYADSNVNENGLKFIQFLNTNLFKYIQQKYNATTFRTYLGQSLTATYGLYLASKYPELFNAYILFSPEKTPNSNHLNYSFNFNHFATYNNPYRFFIGVGSKDIERRITYCNWIDSSLKTNNSALIDYKVYPNKSHMDVMQGDGIVDALNFIFKDSKIKIIPETIKNEELPNWLDSQMISKNQLYGNTLTKTTELQVNIYDNLTQNDEARLDVLAQYFRDTSQKLNDLLYFNTAYTFNELYNNTNKSIFWAEKGLNIAQKIKDTIQILNISNFLGNEIYIEKIQNYNKGWQVFIDAYKQTQNNTMLLLLGKLSAFQKINLADGKTYLDKYLKDRLNGIVGPFDHNGLGYAYFLRAKCNYNLGDKKQAKSDYYNAVSNNYPPDQLADLKKLLSL